MPKKIDRPGVTVVFSEIGCECIKLRGETDEVLDKSIRLNQKISSLIFKIEQTLRGTGEK